MGQRLAVPFLLGMALSGTMLLANRARAQTTNISGMREMRVACLESLINAGARLDELHVFVGQQAERERAASSRVFELQQNAASARRRGLELRENIRQCTNRLARARQAVEQATTSHRTALNSMPGGEDWAKDGSAALSELRRAADAAPQDLWKYKRYKEIEAEFKDALRQWRAAKRSMEQASFDLEMRAPGAAFERTAGQVEAASKELGDLERQLTERQAELDKLSSQSAQWGAAIRTLRDEEAASRDHLAAVRFKFHLVDLRFAAWRLKFAGIDEDGAEMLPDALEESLDDEPALDPGMVTPLSGRRVGSDSATFPAGMAGEPGKEGETIEKGDPAFQKLLARIITAQARLRFLSGILEKEFSSVQAAIGSLEQIEEQARELTDATARLAADLESLRRSHEAGQQTLTTGTDTLALVKKRFAADRSAITRLLDTATEQTAALARQLEQ